MKKLLIALLVCFCSISFAVKNYDIQYPVGYTLVTSTTNLQDGWLRIFLVFEEENTPPDAIAKKYILMYVKETMSGWNGDNKFEVEQIIKLIPSENRSMFPFLPSPPSRPKVVVPKKMQPPQPPEKPEN